MPSLSEHASITTDLGNHLSEQIAELVMRKVGMVDDASSATSMLIVTAAGLITAAGKIGRQHFAESADSAEDLGQEEWLDQYFKLLAGTFYSSIENETGYHLVKFAQDHIEVGRVRVEEDDA